MDNNNNNYENNENNESVNVNVPQDINSTFSYDNIQYNGEQGGSFGGDKDPKKKKGKKVAGYIALVVACSIFGGAVGAVTTYTIIKETTPVTQNKSNSNSNNQSLGSPSTISSMDIPSVVEKVSPAVVGVSTKSIATNMFGFNMGEQEGIGSGFIFSEDGYVLTNYHVIENATQVKVIFNNGKEVNAKVINYQPESDLAVVKITDKVEMPGIAEIGDSDQLRVGEQVIAIGNPLGKEYLGSVTNGIISAVNRDVDLSGNGQKLNLIQTNAAINPGNSGGPLINASGQVIGINTAKIGGEGVEGIGFAIPINDAQSKLDVLVKEKIVLGIRVQDITKEISEKEKLPIGVYIRSVDNFSIAQKGGLQPGDVIVKFAGQKVETVDELNKLKDKHNTGDTIEVEFSRQGQNMKASLKIE